MAYAVLGGEARILSRTRASAFAGLANTAERIIRERLPELDTPLLRDLADDVAAAQLEEYFEESEQEPVDLRDVQRFYQGPTVGTPS